MSIPPIVFVLVILLFGFDSTGQVKTRQQHDQAKGKQPDLKVRARHFRFF